MNLSLALLGPCLLLAAEQAPSNEQVRAAVERALPFVQAEGERWIADKKCVTCHQVPFMVWALNAAADRGLVLNRQKLDECNAWARDWKHMATKDDLELGEQHTLARHNDPVAQLLLGRRRVQGSDASGTWPGVFAERLAAGQQDDGSWKAGGQLPDQKRPPRETQEVSTMWALVALQSYAAADESRPERFAKARAWLGSETEGQSTEWWAVRLLLERDSGNSSEADRLREALLKKQRADGGWGWLCGDESDALGTGVALYALAHDGPAGRERAIGRGRQFLVTTQQPNGSWPVKGTKKNKAKQIEPTSTYWGTCWAVICLAETLPRLDQQPAQPGLHANPPTEMCADTALAPPPNKTDTLAFGPADR